MEDNFFYKKPAQNIPESLNAQSTQGKAFDSYQAANTPVEATHAEGKAADVLHQEQDIPHLRTFQSDIAEALKAKNASTISIAVESASKKRDESKVQTFPEYKPQQEAIEAPSVSHSLSDTLSHISIKSKPTIFLSISGVLIALGLTLVGILLIMSKTPQIEVNLNPSKPEVLVKTDTSRDVTFDTSGNNDSETLRAKLQTEFATIQGAEAGTFVAITIPQASTTESFFAALNTQAPSWFIRSLSPEFTLGYKSGTETRGFLILKTTSYDNGFAGMLKWEGDIAQDLAGILAPLDVSTSSEKAFADSIVKNKNVRELKNADGSSVLVYTVFDRETIIIARDESLLQELFTKLSSSRFVR